MLMPVALMAELMLRAMAGMRCGCARGLLQLHCAVAQEPSSYVVSVFLKMVASLFDVLVSCWRPVVLRHDGGHAQQCALLAGCPPRLLEMARSMLLFGLHCAGLAAIVGLSIFVF